MFRNTLDFFNAICQVITFNKLADVRDYWGRDRTTSANGNEIMAILDPDCRGFSHYFLRNHEVVIKELIDADLIVRRMRSAGPQGYGDDDEFLLTERALEIIQEYKGATRDTYLRSILRTHTGNDYNLDWYLPIK